MNVLIVLYGIIPTSATYSPGWYVTPFRKLDGLACLPPAYESRLRRSVGYVRDLGQTDTTDPDSRDGLSNRGGGRK
ncbi:hypothetical protein DL95DRAFT_379788, partial [Leptodontidium sp. 2 PMI_412]